jgi:hypothetical protein
VEGGSYVLDDECGRAKRSDKARPRAQGDRQARSVLGIHGTDSGTDSCLVDVHSHIISKRRQKFLVFSVTLHCYHRMANSAQSEFSVLRSGHLVSRADWVGKSPVRNWTRSRSVPCHGRGGGECDGTYSVPWTVIFNVSDGDEWQALPPVDHGACSGGPTQFNCSGTLSVTYLHNQRQSWM